MRENRGFLHRSAFKRGGGRHIGKKFQLVANLHPFVQTTFFRQVSDAVLERGTHEALMRANGRYATLYNIQTAPKGSVLQFEVSSTGLRNDGGISRPGAINE